MQSLIAFWVLLSIVTGAFGANKYCGFWRTFIVSLFLSPVTGALVVYFSEGQDHPNLYQLAKQGLLVRLRKSALRKMAHFLKLLTDQSKAAHYKQPFRTYNGHV